MFFHDSDGRVRSLPASWTNVGPTDPFVVIAACRAFFRPVELLALVTLLRQLEGPPILTGSPLEQGDAVKEIMP